MKGYRVLTSGYPARPRRRPVSRHTWLARVARLAWRACLALALFALPATPSADAPHGTFSIVARDSITGELGVAVQSRAFNVGKAVAWAEAGIGAIATQAQTNESYGPRGLELLRSGLDAETTLRELLVADDQREHRQLAIVDAGGGTASWTGRECMAWAGGLKRPGLACQGNILTGEKVVAEMARAYDSTQGTLAERLLAALAAAQAAGGDRRGQQSAALLVVRESETHPEYRHRFISLRVDDDPAPIDELLRLYEMTVEIDLAESYLELAAEAEAAGRRSLAETQRRYVRDALRHAVAKPEKNPQALNSLAWSVAIRDLFLDDALRAAAIAAEMTPDSPEIMDTLAEVHWRAGAYAEAVRVGEAALRLSPEDGYLTGQLEKFRASLRSGKREPGE